MGQVLSVIVGLNPPRVKRARSKEFALSLTNKLKIVVYGIYKQQQKQHDKLQQLSQNKSLFFWPFLLVFSFRLSNESKNTIGQASLGCVRVCVRVRVYRM